MFGSSKYKTAKRNTPYKTRRNAYFQRNVKTGRYGKKRT